MHLFANNAVLRGEITTLMKFFQLIKGDVYAGFRIPGVATAVKNLAYHCVKLQAEIGSDEQILKYNGIGGIQNATPIPLKTYINSLVEKYKSNITAIVVEIPDATTVARYDSRYQRTRDMLNDILAKYLHPPRVEEEEQDVPAATVQQPKSRLHDKSVRAIKSRASETEQQLDERINEERVRDNTSRACETVQQTDARKYHK
jgi:hypothetical protein